MRHHQKYFSVEDAEGNLAPHFVAVMNTNADPEGLVRRGNERVLRARFNDARFFWETDQKKKLADRLPDLQNVTFQAKLGSYFEKTERMVALVEAARRRRARPARRAAVEVRPHHRHGEGIHRSAGRRRRPLRARAGRARSGLAGHLRSLQAGQHGGRHPVHRRRPARSPGRQARHPARLLRRRPDPHAARAIPSRCAAPPRAW